VAGVIDWTSQGGDTPAAQANALAEYLRILESQGVKIDAYVDLNDGRIKGALTPQTTYLIRGLNVLDPKDPKSERAKAVNEVINTLKNEWIDRGLFLISAENFAVVIGYRQPRSASNPVLSGFRPSRPAAGTSLFDLKLEGGKKGGEGGKKGDGK